MSKPNAKAAMNIPTNNESKRKATIPRFNRDHISAVCRCGLLPDASENYLMPQQLSVVTFVWDTMSK
jgi:hypothetical protein